MLEQGLQKDQLSAHQSLGYHISLLLEEYEESESAHHIGNYRGIFKGARLIVLINKLSQHLLDELFNKCYIGIVSKIIDSVQRNKNLFDE